MVNDVEHIVVLQDDNDKNYFETLGATTGDVIITDRCGRLSFQLQMPYSSIRFPYVKAAILSTFHDEPCGPCNIQFDPNMIKGPKRIYQTLDELETITETSTYPTEVTTKAEQHNLSFEATEEANSTIAIDDIGNKTISEEVNETSKQETSNGTVIDPETSIKPDPVVEDTKLSTSSEIPDEEAVEIVHTIENILSNADNITESLGEPVVEEEKGKEDTNVERNTTEKIELDLTNTSGIQHRRINITNLINEGKSKYIYMKTADNNNLDVAGNEEANVHQNVNNEHETEKDAAVDEDVLNPSNSTSLTTNYEQNELKSDEDKKEEEMIVETPTEKILKEEEKTLETSTTSAEAENKNKTDEEVYKTRVFTNTYSTEDVDETTESKEEVYQTHVFNKKPNKEHKVNEKAWRENEESATEFMEEDDISNEKHQKSNETEEDSVDIEKINKNDSVNAFTDTSTSTSTTEADELEYQIKTNKIKRVKSENSTENEAQYLFPITIIMRYPHLHSYKYKLRKHEYLVLETGKPSYHGHLEKDENKDESSEETDHHKIKEYFDEDGIKYTKLIGNKYRDSYGNVIESVEETFSLKEYELSQQEDASKNNKGKVIKGREQLQHHYEKLIPWVRHIMEIQDTDAIDKSKLHRFGENLKRAHNKM